MANKMYVPECLEVLVMYDLPDWFGRDANYSTVSNYQDYSYGNHQVDRLYELMPQAKNICYDPMGKWVQVDATNYVDTLFALSERLRDAVSQIAEEFGVNRDED